MKEIKLTQGKKAFVDDEDFEYLNQWKWYAAKCRNTFYAQRTDRIIGKRTIRMHNLILNNPYAIPDHKDGNGLNNQRNNLRIADSYQNMQNRRSHKNSSSEHLGVSFTKDGKRKRRWAANIQTNNINVFIGRFFTEKEAQEAYKQKAIELHGEFASHTLKLENAV